MNQARHCVPVLIAILIAMGCAGPARAQRLDVAAHFAQSEAAEQNGEISRALNEMLSILRVRPNDYVATLRAGWFHYKLGQYEEATVAYERATQLAPQSIEARLGLTLPLMAQLEWARVETESQKLLRIAPNESTALGRLAWARYNQANYDKAEKVYKRLHALSPSDTEILLGLAWSQIKQGRTSEACTHFRRVLELRSTSVRASAGLDLCAN